MAQRYFENFPIINYSNTNVVDITKRVALLESVSKNPYVFYPYELDVHERADQFSYRYYEDAFQSWLLYLTNKIVDPYYEWYLSETEFNDFLEKKYGSVYAAQTKIKNYRNSWIGDENISVSEYNALPAGKKDYWEPIIGASNVIVSYSRKKIDWEVNTNKIMTYTVNSSNGFVVDEVVDIVYDVNTTGKGQVLSITDGVLNIQHVSGTYDQNNGYIYGTESNSNTNFTTVVTSASNIAEEEQVYWAAVTYYDFETFKNEYNKTVRILDNRYNGLAIVNMKELMKV
jgi:hypothetical protein